MKISTKGRYALRLMLDIAMHDAAGPVRIKDVAARQEISDKYLEQIVSVLNKAGYVRSIREPAGWISIDPQAERLHCRDDLATNRGQSCTGRLSRIWGK